MTEVELEASLPLFGLCESQIRLDLALGEVQEFMPNLSLAQTGRK